MPLEKLTRARMVEALMPKLREPWFSEEFPALRLRLLRDTPSAFKDKNLFVFESALSVA